VYQRVGTQFGEFHIKNVLGAGGMAAVYLALHLPTQQPVALKVLSSQLSHIESFRQRFELEAQITTALSHPKIVPVVAWGAAEDSLYIAMKYVPGGTLHDKFVLDGHVVLHNTAHYLRDIAEGLDYAHSMGVIHRDLKLANVLLDDDGHALLSDFGIARIIESSLHLTESGSVLGSPHYMSPEQNEGKPLDARSDLYSLTVMAFLMVTGQFPFHAETPVAIALQHVTKEPPPPSLLNPALPLALDAVIMKGLAKKPDDRFSNATEFAAAFERAMCNHNVETVVNLPMLTRSRPTPLRSPTPSTLPPIPASLSPKMRLEEETSPSALYRRGLQRYGTGFFLILITVILFFALRYALSILRPNINTPIPPVTATAQASATSPVTQTDKPTDPPTLTAAARVVTATPFRLTIAPSTPISTAATATPIPVMTFNSPYKVIIKGIDRPSNVRSAPDIGATVLTQMYLDDQATVIARTGDLSSPEQTWYLVMTTAGITGWVRGDVVELLPIGSNPTSVPTAVTVPAFVPSLVPTRTPRATLPR
jgi:serine/threonine-protein kinase